MSGNVVCTINSIPKWMEPIGIDVWWGPRTSARTLFPYRPIYRKMVYMIQHHRCKTQQIRSPGYARWILGGNICLLSEDAKKAVFFDQVYWRFADTVFAKSECYISLRPEVLDQNWLRIYIFVSKTPLCIFLGEGRGELIDLKSCTQMADFAVLLKYSKSYILTKLNYLTHLKNYILLKFYCRIDSLIVRKSLV